MTEEIEKVARVLSRVHFNRKIWSGACPKEEWLDYTVDHNWRNHEPDARAAIEALDKHRASTVAYGYQAVPALRNPERKDND